MEFELKVLWAVSGSFGVAMRLLRFQENILKPAQPIQSANICGDSRRVELLAGMKREWRFCRFRCDVMKSYEFDFVNDSIARKAIRCGGSDCTLAIAFLRAREDWCDNEQTKKRHGYRSTTVHLSLDWETN
jgi:hypothetical protein